ncbi:MAG: ATP-binding protein [Desulfobacterales bacterium]
MNLFNVFQAPMSFRAALIIYIVVPLMIAFAVFGYISLKSIEKQVEKQMQKDLELVARAVQLPLSYSLEKERMKSIEQTLASVFAIGRVYSAYVYDQNGKEIVRLGQAETKKQTDRLIELAEGGERRGEYGQVADHQVFSYFVPLTDTGGKINGLLQVTRKKSEFSDNFTFIRIRGAVILGTILVLLSALVLYGHHRALGLHLGRLNLSMSRITRGERQHRFNIRGPMEIVKIGDTFNRMLNSIDEADRLILTHRQEQERLEKELRHSEKLAALGRLAAGTAHELGTPLSVIKGRTQRELRDSGLPIRIKQTFLAVRDEVIRMEHIIKQLLDFSKSNPLRYSLADPAHSAVVALSAVQDEATFHKTIIKYTGPEQGFPIMLDKTRIQQALINLLRNAIQCDSSRTVHLWWHQDEYEVAFYVEDDGPGIPPSQYLKIFEPFYTTKSVAQGTGLGLSVVHAVAEEHGGEVRVGESTLGGACFRFSVSARIIPEKKT